MAISKQVPEFLSYPSQDVGHEKLTELDEDVGNYAERLRDLATNDSERTT